MDGERGDSCQNRERPSKTSMRSIALSAGSSSGRGPGRALVVIGR